jgi:catechol 2,3-dioxygenase-like lactoylglutathione lyase family enzyme
MIKGLWNIGLKIEQLDTELAFLKGVGATLVQRGVVPVGDDEPGLEYAIVKLGGVRMLLFPTVIFEDQVQGGVAPGLTHAVYEVDDLEAEYQRIKALGADVLIEPRQITAGFGTRKLAFFRSPGGLVFEVMQILENTVE